MPRKRTVSFRVDPLLVTKFQEAAKPYYGKVGACLSAAILLWLEQDPAVQGQYLKKLYEAEIDSEVAAVIDGAKAEQLRRIKAREQREKR